uniref:Fatty acid binding protein 10b, liver basic n=1 Tax=Monopterus albus TaxID=43700 RepID=A0A3Q3K7Z5_MONAL
MDFVGTWKVYSEENLEEFLKAVEAPEMILKMRKDFKPTVVIEHNGDEFIYTLKTPVFNKVHSFKLGKETEIITVDGRKYKCTVREENGKLIAQTDKFASVREIQGDEMVEVSGFNSFKNFHKHEGFGVRSKQTVSKRKVIIHWAPLRKTVKLDSR